MGLCLRRICSNTPGWGGRFRPESVAAFKRNQWQPSTGIDGRFRPESVAIFDRNTHPAGDKRNDGLTEIPYVMEATYRDLAAESVYEYGSRAGVWRVQRLIDGYKLPLTCFAAATALERNREVAAWLQEAGHEPCSHGWRWEEVWTLSREEEQQHMLWAIESFKATVGERPQGWYCRYGPSVHTRELLVEEGGFVYDADAYNDDLPYFTTVQGKRYLVVPYSLTYNDARFVLEGRRNQVACR